MLGEYRDLESISIHEGLTAIKYPKSLIIGDFYPLHIGHVKLFQFAISVSETLTVAVRQQKGESDDSVKDRARDILELREVWAVEIISPLDDMASFIARVAPNVVIKGSEYARKDNPEAALQKNLLFDLVFSPKFFGSRLVEDEGTSTDRQNFWDSIPTNFLRDHRIDKQALESIVRERMSCLNVLVVGDPVVDIYKRCDPVGLSREDQHVVFKPKSEKVFNGGAALVAKHAGVLTNRACFLGVVGDDGYADFICEDLEACGVRANLLAEKTRTTVCKTRFRCAGSVRFRLNEFSDQNILDDTKGRLLKLFNEQLEGIDLVIFADFNYGTLPEDVVAQMINQCKEKGVFMAADCQSSSQTGDLKKFAGVDFASATEYECRLAFPDASLGLSALAEHISMTLGLSRFFLKLGAEGFLIREQLEDSVVNYDSLPALNSDPKDVSGAGDALLLVSALAMVAGASTWESSLIGSLAAARQCSVVGSSPLSTHELLGILS